MAKLMVCRIGCSLRTPRRCAFTRVPPLARVQPMQLTVRDIKADGHCLYRSLEDQLALENGALASAFARAPHLHLTLALAPAVDVRRGARQAAWRPPGGTTSRCAARRRPTCGATLTSTPPLWWMATPKGAKGTTGARPSRTQRAPACTHVRARLHMQSTRLIRVRGRCPRQLRALLPERGGHRCVGRPAGAARAGARAAAPHLRLQRAPAHRGDGRGVCRGGQRAAAAARGVPAARVRPGRALQLRRGGRRAGQRLMRAACGLTSSS
jgi:hypothetical protein